MDAARWQRLNDLFHAAVGHAAGERQAWLERVCADDVLLIDEVTRLVRAHERTNALGPLTESLGTVTVPAAGEAPPIASAFFGTDRFTVRRLLGAGGMGIVYEVHDRTRDEIVALKTLLRTSAAAIYRLKREFRSLADVAHANLVALYELHVEDAHCFFTMELINGVGFADYVRAVAGESLRAERARSGFRQLVHGVSELHRRGKLHRDIKPSNVLVTPDGRVVILDFGLIADLQLQDALSGERIAGTPAYMSPEQALGATASESSDWYSVGVTLYEALAGHVPSDTTGLDSSAAGGESDLTLPSGLAEVPDDLRAVCQGLLRREPARRLTGADALLKLDRGTLPASTVTTQRPQVRDTAFVGRQAQLDILDHAFRTIREGRAATVYVSGPSGIDKSALVHQFLSHVRAHEHVVLLSGRCYEHESVPYKALDGVVDSLSHYLAALPRGNADALLPRDVPALAQVFPVLMRVQAVAAAPWRDRDLPDPPVLRRRAFAALRELLARIADRQPVIVYIDDLHWADADSAVLLEELLRPPASPAVLMVVCFRSEEVEAKPFLRAPLERTGVDTALPLSLGPMADEEACALIASVVPGEASVTQDERLQITREAGGNPFFLEQLARHLAIAPGERGRARTLTDVLDARVRELPPGARDFLETLAVCARPMAPSLVCEACGLGGDERPFVALLRAAKLVRSSGSAERLEIYHDQIRNALAEQVSVEGILRIHQRMVQTLMARRIDDPEALFEHCRGAGDRDGASMHADLAARKAEAALAFDRAAVFYGHALALAPQAAARAAWKEALATALANAGRPADAADAYLDAAAGSRRLQRVELERRAAEQLLIGGHMERGVKVLRTVLEAVGMRMAPDGHAALASLMIRRAQLRWRGLTFVERSASQVPVEDLLRIDTCWSAMSGLAMVNNVRAADFETRHLILALNAGEPYRVARAFAAEAAFAAIGGGPVRQRAEEMAERALEMSGHLANPRATALCAVATGLAALMVGEWKQASILSERAVHLLRDRCTGVTWELGMAQASWLTALSYQGQLQDVADRIPGVVTAARDSGNLFVETSTRTRALTIVELAADDPDEAERQADEVMARWSHSEWDHQQFNYMVARSMTALYRCRGDAAWRCVTENRAALRGSLLLRAQLLRVEASYLRGRCALAVAASGRERRAFLAVARGEAHRIVRERRRWSDPLAKLLSAGVASGEGRPDLAADRLAAAADEFDLADMNLYAAVARRRLGQILGGDRGQDLVRQADLFMTAHSVRNPARMTRMFAPGFPDELSG